MASVGEEVLSTPGVDRMTPDEIRTLEGLITTRRERDRRFDALEDRVAALEKGTASHSAYESHGEHGGARPGAGRPEGSLDS
jgi:hypothetical protein